MGPEVLFDSGHKYELSCWSLNQKNVLAEKNRVISVHRTEHQDIEKIEILKNDNYSRKREFSKFSKITTNIEIEILEKKI